jgi:excinuclease ABC subunit C
VEMAQKNAQESAEQRKLKWLNDSQKTTQALAELQEALNLPRLPLRIECYDISTIQGTSTVGSMVVFENGKPKTAAYRRFRIKTVTGTDDFASMAEMVRRRLKRAGAATDERTTPLSSDDETAGSEPVEEGLREHTQRVYEDVADETLDGMLQDEPLDLDATAVGDDEPVDVMALHDAGAEQPVDGAGQATTDDADGRTTAGDSEWTRRPDLMIIDGGKGQLSAVLAVLEELGIADQPIVSLAKQHEELFLPGRSDSIVLPANSQALFLVQRIRDEAHRFAITYHRNVRGKRSLESRLDSVPGVGGRRKRDLLRHFGSVAALRKAGVEEIAALPGIGPKTALAIKEYLGDA